MLSAEEEGVGSGQLAKNVLSGKKVLSAEVVC